MRSPHVKAPRLLAENVLTLLKRHGYSQHDLADHCRHSDVWASQFLNQQKRMWQLEDLDKVADLFGLQTYQLFIPGVSALTDRRSGLDRRSSRERRLTLQARRAGALRAELESSAVGGLGHVPLGATPPIDTAVVRLARQFKPYIDALVAFENKQKPRRQTAGTRGAKPKSRSGDRTARQPDSSGA